MSTNTAEDEEEKRRIEAEQRSDYKSELDKKDELIKAQEEYINFISDEYDLVFPIAQIHGFYCSHKTVAKGESLRNRISELKNKQS